MANTIKFGNGNWAIKEGSTLAYNDENENFKPLPFDFSRASKATVVNKEGLIETIGNDMPRIDYLDNSKGALLLEPQRTNLLTYSEDFVNSYWTKSGSSVVSGVVSPDGSTNAFKLVESSTTAGHFLNTANMSVTSGTTYSEFIYAKKGENNRIQMAFGFDTFSDSYANFDLNLGIVVKENNCIAKIELISNGWYKCSASATCTTTGNNDVVPALINSDTATRLASYTGDGTSGIYIWGAQLEEGNYSTSLIKTNGSTATRVADECNGAGNEQVINSTEGVLYFEGIIYGEDSSNRRIFTISNGTSATAINIQTPSSNSKIEFEVTNGGSTQVIIASNDNSLVYGQKFKVAFAYKLNDFVAYMDGTQIGVDTSATVPLCNEVSFDRGNDTRHFEGSVIQAQIYNTRLSNSELADLTTI